MQPSATARPPDTTQACPNCGATIPVYTGYVVWCDRCNWNVRPYKPARSRNRAEVWYAAASRRYRENLLAEVAARQSLQPHWTPEQILAYMLAALVHSVTLGLALLGLLLVVGSWGYWIVVGLGVLCLVIAWLLRPRFPRLDDADREGLVSRDDCPALFALIDQVERAVGAPPVDFLVVNSDFNAAFATVGWRWQRVLFLGLPLFTILDSRERVVLLGHELGHSVNGDASRGFFVGTAIYSLITWYRLLHPGQIVDPRLGGIERIAAIFANLFLLALATIVGWVAHALIRLLWRNRQRAEYLADWLGAQAGSTDASLSLLEKLHLGPTVDLVARRVSLAGRDQNLFHVLEQEVATVPARELERIRRVERLPESCLDTTHPPTAYRLELLRNRPAQEPAVVSSAEDAQRLEAELAGLQQRVQAELLDKYNRRLYY